MRLDRVQHGALVSRTFVGSTVIEKPIENKKATEPVEVPEQTEPKPKK